MKSIGVQLVDDHPVIQEVINHILQSPQYEVRSRVSSIRDAIEDSKKFQIDFVILDLIFPGASGESLIAHYAKQAKTPAMLVYSSMRDMHLPARCIQAGALGFIEKGVSLKTLTEAIETVAIKQKPFIPKDLQAYLDQIGAKENKLTPRENEIARLIALGMSNHGIAWELGISERTVNIHRTNLMRKIDAHCLSDVIRYALNNRLVASEELSAGEGSK
ncbi:MAG: response regulator transcription factor [Verrucomicrobiota bacterium]